MASKACSECGEMMRWAMGQDKWVCPVCGHEERDSANSRACNSSNPVVRKAMNACMKNAAFDDGSVLVSFKTMGPSKMDAIQKRMSSRDFKTWLEKTGNGSKAQEIWYALMQGDEYSFLSGATRVRVKAL